MRFFNSSKKEEELALVFDIGSSSVGGALFKIEKSGAPEIIFSIREPITIEKEVDFDRFLHLTLKSLGVVANKICMKGLGAPKKIFCILSSPWYASQTRSIKLEKNTPFIFNSKLADSLIQREINLFEEEHQFKYLPAESKIRSIELKNMKTILNGYPIKNPLGQKIKELEMVIFISMSAEQVLQKIEETINRHFHSRDIKFSSFVMASFAVARDMFVHQENFLLVDIGGEMSDITMIKKDILRESVSYPMGYNFFIRGVSDALKCSLSEAKSAISLYKDNHTVKSVEEKFEVIINKLKTEWLKKFQEALVNLSNDISIPSTIFITVEPELASFFTEIIKTEQFSQYSLTESKFRVIFLGTQVLHGIATFKENIKRDPFIIIESIYINRFLS